MPVIETDVRNTRESARRIRYERGGTITATNVQDAINQSVLQPHALTGTAVTAAQSPYTPNNNDSYLLIDTTAGAVTINLQASALRVGLPLGFKDVAGNASVNPISLVPNGAETVDGLAPYPIDSNYAAVQLGPKTAGGYYVLS